MKLTPQDIGLQSRGADESWQESVYLAWGDRKAQLGGNIRIGVQTNRGVSNTWCGVYHGRDKIFRHNLENQPIVEFPAGTPGMGCGPQRMFHDGKDHRYQLDTPECQIDLVITDFDHTLESLANDKSELTLLHHSHYNIQCRVRGTVVLNGVRHEIADGLGWRDHSWGKRRWDNVRTHRAFTGNFGPDLNLHVMAILNEAGISVARHGLLVRNGRREAIRDFSVRTELLEDGFTPVRARVHVMREDGTPLTFGCTVQKGVFAGIEMYQGFFGVGTCHLDGHEDGFCHFELTNNPRLGTRPLGLGLGNTLENGYFETQTPAWEYQAI